MNNGGMFGGCHLLCQNFLASLLEIYMNGSVCVRGIRMCRFVLRVVEGMVDLEGCAEPSTVFL